MILTITRSGIEYLDLSNTVFLSQINEVVAFDFIL